MRVDVLVPDLGLGDCRTMIGQWLVDVGASIQVGDALVEILAPGVLIELPASVAGRLIKITAVEDERVVPGRRLAVIETSNDRQLLDSDADDR